MGLCESQVDDSHVKATHLTAIKNALVNLAGLLAAGGFNWNVVSFIEDGAPRVGGPISFGVTGILFVDDVVDSQRRRLPGRGI